MYKFTRVCHMSSNRCTSWPSSTFNKKRDERLLFVDMSICVWSLKDILKKWWANREKGFKQIFKKSWRNLKNLYQIFQCSLKSWRATLLNLKGAQAWDIRRRVFYTVKACMGRWLRNWEINLISFMFEAFYFTFNRRNICLAMSATALKKLFLFSYVEKKLL